MNDRRGRQLGVQIVRRCVQAGVLLGITGLVFLSLYAHYRAARALDDLPTLAGAPGVVLPVIDRRVGALEHPQRFLDDHKGTLWSLRLGGVDITDPLAAVEVVAASKTLYAPLLLSTLIPVVLALLLGRVFCSWVCPGYLLFEVGGKVRRLLRLAELDPPEVAFSKHNKYIFLGVGLTLAAVTGRPLFALLYPPAITSRLIHAWVFGTAATGAVVVLGTILIFEIAVSPRWFCRTLCPGGALWALLGVVRPLRVRLDPDRCTGCRKCRLVCEEGLDPVRESAGMECDNCARCVKTCPEGALGFKLGWKTSTAPQRPARPTVLAACAAAVAGVLLGASAARAHHILGLPHYSYKENYPQVPTLEYPATSGPYDILLTSYPGRPNPGEPANLAFYIKNRASGEPYGQPVSVRVLQTFTFGRNRTVESVPRLEPFNQIHELTATFPEAGEYMVELSLAVEGKNETLPFLVVAGNPSPAGSILVAVGGGLVLFLITVRAVKIKRARRAAADPPG